jgi:hypothetical protein
MMNPEAQTIEITDGFAHLTLNVQRRESVDAHDCNWGGAWMVTRLRATTPGFQVDFTASLHLNELVELREQVRQMHSTLQGEAELEAMDGWLDLKAEMDRTGHVHWSVEITHPTGSPGARLQFEINNDQTYLPDILNQIDAVLATFFVGGGA